MNEILAFNVRRLCAERGWRNKDLAANYPKEGGTTAGYASQLMNGQAYPAEGTIQKLKEVFQVSEEELIRPPLYPDDEYLSRKLAPLKENCIEILHKFLDILHFRELLDVEMIKIIYQDIDSFHSILVKKLQEGGLPEPTHLQSYLLKFIK